MHRFNAAKETMTLDSQDNTVFLSTREVAKRLKVAVSTVQMWVETGVLPAWKTAGGHRRIPEHAVEAMRAGQMCQRQPAASAEVYRILVVEDDPVQCELYRQRFEEWALPLRLFCACDGFEALLLIGQHRPDLIITDLAMPGMDGFQMIRRLRSMTGEPGPDIIVVTALSTQEIAGNGGLPEAIPVYPKPIPFAALYPMVKFMAEKRLEMKSM